MTASADAVAAPDSKKPPAWVAAGIKGKKIRGVHSDCKKKVAAGELDVCDVILGLSMSPECQSMAIEDLLKAQHRWGKLRIQKLLIRIPLWERKTVGNLTNQQRSTLVALLRSGKC